MEQPRSLGPTTERPQLPSTYQQVIENMRYIQEELLPKIEILNRAVFNPDPDKKEQQDVVIDPDDIMRVVGVTVVTENIYVDTAPSDYTRNVTFELKSAEVVGLKGRNGITLPLVLIRTISMQNVEGVSDYPTWQCAYGDIAMTMYFRKSEDNKQWGDWVPVIDLPRLLEQNDELMKKVSHRQFVHSDTEPGPDEQEPGDYWVQSIFPEGYFFQSIVNSTDIIPVNAASSGDYQFEQVDGGEKAEAGNMSDYELQNQTEPAPTGENSETGGASS